MENYDFVFESDNICYIKMTEILINEYMAMYMNQDLQHQLFKNTFSSEAIFNWLQSQLANNNNNNTILSMIEKSTYEFIGNLEIISEEKNMNEIIISITPNQQNKHFGREAMEAIAQYCYDVKDASLVYLYVKKENKRAIRCYENAGFSINGPGITDEDIQMIYPK
ncbi:MAG: GNAT family protein [Bacilli bacterium]|nr:GNAT family protein [Bacilli bacterium]